MVAWEETGSGPPLVFVHGFTEDRHVWHRAIPLFDGFRCINLDLRGHGATPMADDLSPLAMAEDVAAVVAQAGVDEPPVVIGHSMGGVVVTAYASQAPTKAVVNVDQPLKAGDFARAIQPIGDQLRGPEFRSTLHAVFESLGIDKLAPDDQAYVNDHVDHVPHEVVLGAWGIVLDSDPDELDALVEGLLPSIRVPYLALYGTDPGDAYRQWMTRLLPQTEFEIWEGDGHFIQLVEPQRFADRVKEFVQDSS